MARRFLTVNQEPKDVVRVLHAAFPAKGKTSAAPKGTNGDSLSQLPANPRILEDAICRVPDPDLGWHGKAEP
jgi:hypothetical protein